MLERRISSSSNLQQETAGGKLIASTMPPLFGIMLSVEIKFFNFKPSTEVVASE
ncbi:MAG: hypothetical protein IPP15_23600 [Saprospiraceae bacterium]|uniref:Uncharacterized protein n=1 Tax=Candidatus Opimibacter skivensis TaxID=2982028 RepID=A0A9D7XUT6_9BACT|nr:hypothetical protein [Candidatus Opimibacter skivensis]